MLRNGAMLLDVLEPSLDKEAQQLRDAYCGDGDDPWCLADGVGLLAGDEDHPPKIDRFVDEFLNRRGGVLWKRYCDTIDSEHRLWNTMTHDDRVEAIWAYFDNRVDLASLFLFAYAPTSFVVYRNLDFEDEIFDGLALLSSSYPELTFDFRHIGRNDRAGYEKLNRGLQHFAARRWQNATERPARLLALLYRVLPDLCRPRVTEPRYWVGVSTDPDNMDEIRTPGVKTTWSSNRRAKPGDLYFVYCARPHSSLCALFEVLNLPECDPFGGWNGHWIDIRSVARFEVPFARMKAHWRLGEWTCVRRSFQGITLEQIAPYDYASLRELLLDAGVDERLLPTVDLDAQYGGGKYATEAEFETEQIVPLLKKLGFPRPKREASCDVYVGCQRHPCRIDFLVTDSKGRPLVLFENKKAIKSYRQQDDAWRQARSYAQQLAVPCFILGSPEGLKVYRRDKRTVDFPGYQTPNAEFAWPGLQTERELRRLKKALSL